MHPIHASDKLKSPFTFDSLPLVDTGGQHLAFAVRDSLVGQSHP